MVVIILRHLSVTHPSSVTVNGKEDLCHILDKAPSIQGKNYSSLDDSFLHTNKADMRLNFIIRVNGT